MELRRLRSALADVKGQFGVSSLPPGDYYVVAVQEEPPGDWRDPASLDALARIATQITIPEGEHKTIDLRVHEVSKVIALVMAAVIAQLGAQA